MSAANLNYRVFTTKHDVTIGADELETILSANDAPAWQRFAGRYDQVALDWLGRANLAAISVVDRIKNQPQVWRGENTIVSLVVDHSNSLRGQKAILACAAVEVLADLFGRLGIAYEILGFTTRSWKGGSSRKDWRFKLRRPKKPGRLCDLLHIIYRHADDHRRGAPWSVRYLFRNSLLKENVDGEALLWAADRILARPEKNRCIIVISDGAPVDDSTLAANGENFLRDHLNAVIEDLTINQGIRLGAVGLGYDVAEFYKHCIELSTTTELSEDLPRFAGDLIAGKLD